MELKDEVRRAAEAAGIGVFGVASLDAPPESGLKDRLACWLAEGRHGTMAWMERNNDLRLAPERFLLGAKSVLLFGMDSRKWGEPTPDEPVWSGMGAGVSSEVPAGADYSVARYARGRDYHKVFAGKLRKICALLAEQGGEQRACVDTAPVFEKLLATRAGLGWQGRNTLLIHPRLGPWLLLGAVFTTLHVPADTPIPARCGTCRRCVCACPTGALDGGGALDARRCVAYLTIEHKGAIPPELRPLVGNRLFGCDICLEACPWGRQTACAGGSPSDSAGAAETRFPARLRDSLAWDEAEFARRFNGTPPKRSGLHGWIRNACVVLGNTGTLDDIPALLRLAHADDPVLSEHARWAEIQIRARAARAAPSRG